jgi:hypothetical protein
VEKVNCGGDQEVGEEVYGDDETSTIIKLVKGN